MTWTGPSLLYKGTLSHGPVQRDGIRQLRLDALPGVNTHCGRRRCELVGTQKLLSGKELGGDVHTLGWLGARWWHREGRQLLQVDSEPRRAHRKPQVLQRDLLDKIRLETDVKGDVMESFAVLETWGGSARRRSAKAWWDRTLVLTRRPCWLPLLPFQSRFLVWCVLLQWDS